MKDVLKRIEGAQKAKLKQAFFAAEAALCALRHLTNEFDKEQMKFLRLDCEELLQAIHEYSAYQNALHAIKNAPKPNP
jgi:hypothetical protein